MQSMRRVMCQATLKYKEMSRNPIAIALILKYSQLGQLKLASFVRFSLFFVYHSQMDSDIAILHNLWVDKIHFNVSLPQS